MEKKRVTDHLKIVGWTKLLRVMKLTVFLIFVFVVDVSASLYSQNSKVSIKVENGTLSEIFERIERQSEFRFFYQDEQIQNIQRKSINVSNQKIEVILSELLNNTALDFKIMDRHIILFNKTGVNTKTQDVNQQQQKSVSGKVYDSSGVSLPGVSIVVKGTTTGTITDGNGKFLLSNVPENAILLFSFVGMKSQEVPVSGKSNLNVSLQEESIGIEEVVAVGYGVQKKSDITGSVSSIKSEELKLLPTQRADQAIQGRTAGVMVLNTDGAPGGNTTIRIRGMNSIIGGNEALIVIDGLQGANINTIDPNDIESMEILKDASATAIYGSRGANGVILITTKGNKKGKPAINYSFSYGLQSLAKKLDFLNPFDYASLVNEQRARGDVGVTPLPVFTDAQLAQFKTMGKGTDWQDAIYRVAPMQNHLLSLNGGNDNTTYYFSLGYLNQDGILINSGYKRFNIRGNLNSQINNWIKAGINLAIINTDGSVNPFGGNSNSSFLSNSVILAPQWPSYLPVYDANGNYTMAPNDNGPVSSWNPVASILETSTRNYQIDNNVNAYLEFDLAKGLKLKVNGSANVITNNNRTYWNSKTKEGISVDGLSGKGFVDQYRYEQYQNSNILTYDRTIEKHHFTITGVVEELIQQGVGNHSDGEQFAFDPNGLNDLAGAKIIHISSINTYKKSLMSYLGRLNYIFADKYLLTASIRRDGSSVFGAKNKWGNFPSAALGWRMSEEPFIKQLGSVSDLKLRTSWGITGNQAIGSYQSLASIYSNPGSLNYPYNGTDNTTQIGYALGSSANPSLKWESTEQINLGLDFGFFKNRLTGTVDAYKKTTSNLLMYRSLPGYTGFYAVLDNVGKVENKGLEITIGGDPYVGEFKWHTNVSVSWLKNEVLDLGKDSELEFQSSGGGYGTGKMAYLKKGDAFGSWYGFNYLGTWKENERAAAAEYGKIPGDAKYFDKNEDGQINMEDRMKIGNALPKMIFGWSNTFSYKNFDLTVLLQGVSGNDVFNTPRIRLESNGGGTSTALLDKWTPSNPNSNIPAMQKASYYLDLNAQGKVNTYNIDALYEGATSRWVEDGSYLRVKNITLSYTLPKELTGKIGINNSKVFVGGTNLLTFTKYKGYDPEVSSYTGNDASMGIDFGNYPPARTYTFGLEVSF